MNTWSENRAEEVRIEVDLIVGEPGSIAGEETKRNYLTLTQREIEHWHARERALLGAAGALLSRAQVAQFAHPELADKYIRHATRMQEAFKAGRPMTDAIEAHQAELA